MAKKNIQPLKGFRDFLPEDAIKRQWLEDKIRETFELWGYDPMETPTLEPLELFEGQVGEDEKLFYKFEDQGKRKVALRYDQTVPTCRVVGSNWQNLSTPFKRYQIQMAYRAEKPQKGRYREFLQADADIFGIDGPSADAEVIALSLDIYKRLGFKKFKVLVSDRSLLKNIPYEALASIDKLGKIGEKGVITDMVIKGMNKTKAKGYLKEIKELKPNENIIKIFEYLENLGFDKTNYDFAPNIIRSFSYSTGPIWEVVIPGASGSVLGGERYDKLIEEVSGKKIPGTGFAVGFDRTFEIADEMGLLPKIKTSTKVLVTIFSEKQLDSSIKTTQLLRNAGLNAELYTDPTSKLQKQLKYADKKKIPWAVIIGPEEVLKDAVVLKNLKTKKQETVALSALLSRIK